MNRLNLTLLLSTGLMTTAIFTADNATDQSDESIVTPIEAIVKEVSLDSPAKVLHPSIPASETSETLTSG